MINLEKKKKTNKQIVRDGLIEWNLCRHRQNFRQTPIKPRKEYQMWKDKSFSGLDSVSRVQE